MLNARRNLSSANTHAQKKTAAMKKKSTSGFDDNVRFAIFCFDSLGICIKLFETCSTLLLPAAVDVAAATLESLSLDRA